MEKTSVEWLMVEIFKQKLNPHYENLLEQAKEMEKQQMFDYIEKNYVNGENSLKFHQEEFEKYYNEIFKAE